MSGLDGILAKIKGAITFFANGVEKPLRTNVNIIGASIVDNVAQDRLDITIAGAAASSLTPQAVGTATAGAHTAYSRDDHVHAHGNQLGGALHAGASSSAAGFMSTHDFDKLDAIDLDQLVMQSAWKQAARCVVTTNVVLTARVGDLVADDVELETGDRVLLVGQTDKTQNGFWLDQGLSTPMIRPTDFDANDDVILGLTVRVTEGRQYAGSTWYLSSPTSGAPALGTDALEFTELDVPQLKFDLDSVSAVPMRIAGRNRVVFDATSLTEDGRIVLALALTGHAEGGYLEGFIPAGLTDSDLGDTALARAGDLNAEGWDAYDPASHYAFAILYTNGAFLSTGRNLGLRDTTAPTISTASVFTSDADRLIVVFSEPVFLDLVGPLQGITLTVHTGAACTITGVVSGNGTDTVEFDLSRDIVNGDSIDLVIGSTRLLQDLNGTKIATVTFPIDLTAFATYTMPAGLFRFKGSSLSVSGSDVTACADLIGSWNLAPPATKPTVVTSGGKTGWKIISGSYLKGDNGSSVDWSVGSVLIVAKFPTNTASYEDMIAMGLASNLVLTGMLLYWYPGLGFAFQRDGQTGTGDTNLAGAADTAIHAYLVAWDHAGAKIYKDGTQICVSAVACTAAAVKRLVLGVAPDLSTSPATGAEYYEVYGSTQKLTGADITDAFAFAHSEYGTP
jgi:hypothetical protein